MGCNYFLVNKNEIKILEKVNILLEKEKAYFFICHPMKIHLGKSSGGWQFCFNDNNWKYYSSRLDMIYAWTMKYQIVDDFDNKITFKEFWDIVKKSKNQMFDEQNCRYVNGLMFFNGTNFS